MNPPPTTTSYGSTLEATDPFCLRDGEAQRLIDGHPWRRFAVLGDSVAEGLGDPVPGYSPLPWADRIAAELSAERSTLAYLNLGTRNQRTAQVLAGQLEPALTFQPDLALVCCGGYDAIHPSYQPEAVDRDMATIITALRDGGCDVITVGLFDLSHCPGVPERFRALLAGRMAELARRTRSLSDRLGTIHIDLSQHPAVTDPGVYSADGLHGNLRSHAICAAETIRGLGAHLVAVHRPGD